MKNFVKILCAFIALALCLFTFVSCDVEDVIDSLNKGESVSEGADTNKETVTEKENAKPDEDESSSPGEGVDINMEAVKLDIGSMSESDFGVVNGESDYVLIKIKNYGSIVVYLREDVAPATVKNFKKLVSEGFYNGTIFHRVIENFMIQGGGIIIDEGEYVQKKTDSIYGEFTDNGFENNLLHVRGVISMARTSVPDSATSQFFIMHVDYPYLDYKYASFGYVLAGLDVVDAIATCATNYSDMPYDIIEIVSISFVMPYGK